MIAPLSYKSDVLWRLRSHLRDLGFVEMTTPVVRRNDDETGRRAPVELGGKKQLRSMIGPALRYTLQFHPRVFEIGPCFRTDTPDATHAREFSMLDLYAANEGFAFLFSLAEDLVRPFVSGRIQRLSVADRLKDAFGIDLHRHGIDAASAAKIAAAVGLPHDAPWLEVIERFVTAELEPLSKGKAMFLHDYPAGGNEPCAKLQDGTAAVLNRFELFIDGVEVVHGYEDETDGQALQERARQVRLWNIEQSLIQDEIAAGRVPANSVGLGIGIERLCMAATGIKDISTFLASAPY